MKWFVLGRGFVLAQLEDTKKASAAQLQWLVGEDRTATTWLDVVSHGSVAVRAEFSPSGLSGLRAAGVSEKMAVYVYVLMWGSLTPLLAAGSWSSFCDVQTFSQQTHGHSNTDPEPDKP